MRSTADLQCYLPYIIPPWGIKTKEPKDGSSIFVQAATRCQLTYAWRQLLLR